MGTRIKIMDLELDLLTEETFLREVEEYLSNDFLNVIHLISLDYMGHSEENELVHQTLEQADLVLPGEKAILSYYHVDILETGGMIVDYRTASQAVNASLLSKRKCYLILENRTEARVIYRYLVSHFPDMEIVGLYTADGNITEEALVNDINTKLPDLVLMALESPRGEEWIDRNKLKINAKLCVMLGSVIRMMIRDNIRVPKALRVLHLGKLYTCLARIPYSNKWRRRIFQKKMDNYNSKKRFDETDAIEELSDEKKD